MRPPAQVSPTRQITTPGANFGNRIYVADQASDKVLVFRLVPEPTTTALLLLGILSCVCRRRRK